MSGSIFNNIRSGQTKSQFKEFIKKVGNAGLKAEYEEKFERNQYSKQDIQTGLLKQNCGLSRYCDIYCYDKTRIQLQNGRFIHANWADGGYVEKKFILAQGPTKASVNDFYEMIITYKVPIILNTTKLQEFGHEKCYPYWPVDSSKLTNDNYEVIKSSFQENPIGTILSDLKINFYQKNNKVNSHELKHIHFLNWPDHGVPKDPTEFNHLVDLVENIYKNIQFEPTPDFPHKPPILVHCSAGIGRTGTFALISILREIYTQRQIINIPETLTLLRQQRIHCVQTSKQYAFCYVAMDQFTNRI